MTIIARKLSKARVWRFYAYLVYAATLLIVAIPFVCWHFAPSFRAVEQVPADAKDTVAYIATVADFYQSIIALLSLAIGVFSVVAFVTIPRSDYLGLRRSLRH